MEAGEEDGDSPMTNLEHDDTHDWHEDRNTLELNNQKIREAAKWLKEQKETFELASENTVLNPNTLNEDQRLVHDVAMDAMEGEQKLIDVSGGAGTGKSHTINCIIQSAKERYGEDTNPVVVIAPTGAAASQFAGGKTIHSLLKLGINKKKKKGEEEKFKDLSSGMAQELEHTLKGVRLIVIDEKSMMGKGVFAAVDRRLRQARPTMKHKMFGGISIMLAGDFRQLPPVGDVPLYCAGEGRGEQVHGGLLYLSFDENTFFLKKQMRQKDPTFIQQMDRLGNNTYTEDDFYSWQESMDLNAMTPERQKLFTEKGTMFMHRVVEDRSVLVGFPDGFNGPTGS